MSDIPIDQTKFNPFQRLFQEDGTVDQEYMMKRLTHLRGLLDANPAFIALRFDRIELERMLAENQDVFAEADSQEEFDEAYRNFGLMALPKLNTPEFDEKAKEILRQAIVNSDLTRRDRAAAACGLVLTKPEDGQPAQADHENPFLDMVLMLTFNESMARVDFLRELAQEEISETEREARMQEFFRSVPALWHEMQTAFEQQIRRALSSYERGEYSFGIGLDMILHGLRSVRQLSIEWEREDGESFTEEQSRVFADRFGAGIREAYGEDIGEDEEREILHRMAAFLERSEAAESRKSSKGLRTAIGLMADNPEVRYRLLLAGYHEAVTGNRLFRLTAEEESARDLFADPFLMEPYLAYGNSLESAGELARAERVYRNAMEFFPEEDDFRVKLEAVAQQLEPERAVEVQANIAATELEEE